MTEPKLTDLATAIQKAIGVTRDAGHQTFWMEDAHTPEGGKIFVFVSWDNTRAQQAEDALRAANCLCHSTLGKIT